LAWSTGQPERGLFHWTLRLIIIEKGIALLPVIGRQVACQSYALLAIH
jgi:hypothetical protein